MDKHLNTEQAGTFLAILEKRFTQNMQRHEGLDWSALRSKLESNPEKLWTLEQMEQSGGEPDVIGYDAETAEYLFCDCAPESPAGRRSLCYDPEALAARKEHKPKDSAVNLAASMGTTLLTEAEYRKLQELGRFDLKTSSWIATPEPIRALGGALFCDRRYDHVFTYHNGADSYYGSRGFRCLLRV